MSGPTFKALLTQDWRGVHDDWHGDHVPMDAEHPDPESSVPVVAAETPAQRFKRYAAQNETLYSGGP